MLSGKEIEVGDHEPLSEILNPSNHFFFKNPQTSLKQIVAVNSLH